MKLADVTSSSQTGGLPVWNFDSVDLPTTLEETTEGDGESIVEKSCSELKDEEKVNTVCNGHDKPPGNTLTLEKNGKVFSNNSSNNNDNFESSPTTTATSNLANSTGAEQHTSPAASLTSGGTACSQDTRKVDPVFEIALDLQVKIADLGNACWVVSLKIRAYIGIDSYDFGWEYLNSLYCFPKTR